MQTGTSFKNIFLEGDIIMNKAMDNRQKLHQMIDRIDSDRALAYLESFIKHWINEFSVDLKGGQGYEE